jgi:hypothetical protein
MGADALAIETVTFVGGPDVSAWPVTTTITRVDVHLDGVEIHFDKRDGPNRWPDNTTPGWEGPLQYSLGMVLKVNDHWHASAPIETWFGKNVIGGPIQSQDIGDGRGQVGANWFYDSRWSPLHTHQPQPGESIGLFVVAGDARNSFNPLKERSNIVLITLPQPNTTGVFTFTEEQVGQEETAPPATAVPTGDLKGKVEELSAKIDALKAELIAAGHAENQATRDLIEKIRRDLMNDFEQAGGKALIDRLLQLMGAPGH